MTAVNRVLDHRVGRLGAQLVLVVLCATAALLLASEREWLKVVAGCLLAVAVLVTFKMLLMIRQDLRNLDRYEVSMHRSQLEQLRSDHHQLKTMTERTLGPRLDELSRNLETVAQDLPALETEIERRIEAARSDIHLELEGHSSDLETLAERVSLLAKQTGPAFALLAMIENDLLQLRAELRSLGADPT